MLLVLLMLALALPPALQAQFNYTTNSGGANITGYTGSSASVIIPDVIDGQPVNSIGTWAFAYNTSLVSVTIPNSVTTIGEWAFYGCSLTGVTIGNNVTNIDNNAFFDCDNLVSITLGSSVVTIGNSAFASCSNLVSVTIPSSVASIGNSAFSSCGNLTSVYFLDDAPSLGSSVFNGDNNTTVYHIPGTTGWTLSFGGRPTALGNPLAPQTQFNFTTNNGAITITSYAGAGGAVVIPEKINNLPVTTLGISAFFQCVGLTSVTIPDGVTYIPDWTFYGCTHLTTATIGTGVTYIGESAFNGCGNLTSVYFHGNAPTLGPSAFKNIGSTLFNYLPGTTGWSTTFAGYPAQLWNAVMLPTDGMVGVQANRFGFDISGNTNVFVVVEATTNLTTPDWSVAGTVTLTGDTFYFIDPLWTNYPARFYRLRTP